ncbi:MAG: hypothetical protein ACI9MR_003744 [Myxococcota bacterium]|jgi:hypothetical protein
MRARPTPMATAFLISTTTAPAIANPGQANLDNDLLGDDCDDDDDGDGVLDVTDNCACEVNASQSDLDQDGIGDVCDNSFEGGNLVEDVDATASEASEQITASGVSGSSGLITKIQGNPNGNGSGSNSVAAIVAAAVGDYFAGYIDCATYVSWLQDGLTKLTAFDNQLAVKIGNGNNKLSAAEAAPIQTLSAELRALDPAAHRQRLLGGYRKPGSDGAHRLAR